MTETLKFSDCEISSSELIRFLTELDLLPSLIKRHIERSSSASFRPTQSQQISFQQAFLQREKISSPQSLQAWLDSNDITEPQLSKQLFHALQLKQFKDHKFSSQVETTFLDNKSLLDKVMYSMIRSSERAKVNELHLRIKEEEDTFADLATEYSEGVENQFNGLVGPIELGRINSSLAERLRISRPGQLWDPFELEGWWILLRLEKSIPARLDQPMKQRITDDLYNAWMRQQVKQELSSITSNSPLVKQILTPQPVHLNNSPSNSGESEPASATISMFRKVWDKLSTSQPND